MYLIESDKQLNFHFSFLKRKQEQHSLTFASVELMRKLLFMKYCKSGGQLAIKKHPCAANVNKL